MLVHHFDPVTKVYTSSEELTSEVDNSTSKPLPETTEIYTVAFIDGEWVSVIRPEYEVVNSELVLKQV